MESMIDLPPWARAFYAGGRPAVVAGGAGFLGAHLVRALSRAGAEVVVFDDLSTSEGGRLEYVEGIPGAVEVFKGSACKPSTWRRALSFPDPSEAVVFHLASPASPPAYRLRQIATLEANGRGTMLGLEAADAVGARLVFASSSEVYGDPLEHPQREWYRGNVDPVGTRSCYDEGKRYGEALCAAYHRERGVDARIARIFNTYGPGQDIDDGRVVPAFARACAPALVGEEPGVLEVHGDGSQTRSFCFAEDTARGLLLLGATPAAAGPVNLGSEDERTVRGLAELLRGLTVELGGRAPEIRYVPQPDPEDPAVRRPSIDLARTFLEWEPRVDLREGLARTLHDFARRGVS